MLKFVPDHLNTKQMCSNAVKEIAFKKNIFLINIKLKMCIRAIPENSETL